MWITMKPLSTYPPLDHRVPSRGLPCRPDALRLPQFLRKIHPQTHAILLFLTRSICFLLEENSYRSRLIPELENTEKNRAGIFGTSDSIGANVINANYEDRTNLPMVMTYTFGNSSGLVDGSCGAGRSVIYFGADLKSAYPYRVADSPCASSASTASSATARTP